jgi:hypothetical protein
MSNYPSPQFLLLRLSQKVAPTPGIKQFFGQSRAKKLHK